LLGSFTCPKVGTWDRLFDVPSEGRHAEDFYIRKILRLRPGLNPRSREPEASRLTTTPPKTFLWGYTRKIVYAEKIRNIQRLQERITTAIETVTRDMIQKTCWRATKGKHIEIY
jgi:hypothetical protein